MSCLWLVSYANSIKQILLLYSFSLWVFLVSELKYQYSMLSIHFKAHIFSVNAGEYLLFCNCLAKWFFAYKRICVGAFLFPKMGALLVLCCSTYLWKNMEGFYKVWATFWLSPSITSHTQEFICLSENSVFLSNCWFSFLHIPCFLFWRYDKWTLLIKL